MVKVNLALSKLVAQLYANVCDAKLSVLMGHRSLICTGSVVAEQLIALNSNSGVSDQQSVGSNPKP